MRVIDHLDFPGMHGTDGDADFFLQFAPQRLLDAFARFQLAAGKLPITLINLAGRAGREQELAIGPDQYAHRHLNHLAPRTALARLCRIGNQHLVSHCAVPACCPA